MKNRCFLETQTILTYLMKQTMKLYQDSALTGKNVPKPGRKCIMMTLQCSGGKSKSISWITSNITLQELNNHYTKLTRHKEIPTTKHFNQPSTALTNFLLGNSEKYPEDKNHQVDRIGNSKDLVTKLDQINPRYLWKTRT